MAGPRRDKAKLPGRVVALRGVIFQSDLRDPITQGLIRPMERVDRWVAGLYRSGGPGSHATHAGLHVVLADGRELVGEQQIGPLYQDFANGLQWTPIEQFRERQGRGWDLTVPATAFRGVDERVVAETTARLNRIEGRPFLEEDCTAFVERAVGGRRLFADSPVLRRLGVNARVGDPALPLLRRDAPLEPRAARLLRVEALLELPDAVAEPLSPNASQLLGWGLLAAAVGAGGGSLLAYRDGRSGR